MNYESHRYVMALYLDSVVWTLTVCGVCFCVGGDRKFTRFPSLFYCFFLNPIMWHNLLLKSAPYAKQIQGFWYGSRFKWNYTDSV